MIHFILETGRIVKLQSFCFNYTYEGLFGGVPNKSHNERIVAQLNYPEAWGTYNVMLIMPSNEDFKTQLKPIRYCALLESSCINPNDTINDGSMLVVIWYGEEPNFSPIEKLLEDSLKGINWDEHADNYKF